MNTCKILVTGGAGNIGGALVERLVQDRNNYVVVVDNLLTGSLAKLPDKKYDNWCFYRCDVNEQSEIASVMRAHNFDFVFHYAALVGVERTLNNPVQVLRDLEGIKNVLNLSVGSSVRRVFYASSSEVYGESMEYPQNEDTTPLNSRLPYAIVKNAGEAFLKSYQKVYGLPYTIFRFFNTYGPRQSEDFVLPRFISKAMKNVPIQIYGDGSQTRTFCYIDDNIEVTTLAMQHGHFVNNVLNVGNDMEISILELAKMVINITGSHSQIRFLPPLPEGDMTRRMPDITKMRGLLCRELTSLTTGIENLIAANYKALPGVGVNSKVLIHR